MSNILKVGFASLMALPVFAALAQTSTDPVSAAAAGLATAQTGAGSTSGLVVGVVLVGVTLAIIVAIVRKA